MHPSGDEADNLRGCQRRVDNHHRDAGATCFDHRANQSAIVEWGEHDAIDALAEKAFDDLHLLLAIVFAHRPLPHDVHRQVRRRQLA
jgi:hypothetical protein